MLPDSDSIPALESSLLKNEELLWAARPCREFSKSPFLRKWGVLIVGAFILWIGGLFLLAGREDLRALGPITLVFLLGFVIVGFGHRWAYYALTDHRVISGADKKGTMNEIPLRQITGMTLTESKDGSGKILLTAHEKPTLEVGMLNEVWEVARRIHQAILEKSDTAKDPDAAGLDLYIDAEAESQIRRQMIPGESLLWADRPRRRMSEEPSLREEEEKWIRATSRPSLRNVLLGTAGCVLFPMSASLILLVADIVHLANKAPDVWILAAVWFLINSGFVIYRRRWRQSRISRSHRTFYGVTSSRATFIFHQPQRSVVQSCFLQRVKSVRRKPTPLGVGTIYFAAEGADLASDGSVFSPGRLLPDVFSAPRFSLVADAEKVEELLLRLL